MKVLCYGYYLWKHVANGGVTGTDPEQYMTDVHKLAECGYFGNVTYSGQLMCSCGGRDEYGLHYALIMVGEKKDIEVMLKLTNTDIQEFFEINEKEEIVDKLNHEMERVELV